MDALIEILAKNLRSIGNRVGHLERLERSTGGGGGVTDHTLLTNIGTNTHPQIDTALTRLVNTSGNNTGDQNLTGYLKLDASNDPIIGDLKLVPTANSITTFEVFQQDGTTPVLKVDTTNIRVGVGIVPTTMFELGLGGVIKINDDTGARNSTIEHTSGGYLKLNSSAGGVTIYAAGVEKWKCSGTVNSYFNNTGLGIGYTTGVSDYDLAVLGSIGIGIKVPTARLFIDGATDMIQAIIQGHSTQTANIQEWQSSAAAILASISGAGVGLFAGLSITDAKDIVLGTTTGTKFGTATNQKMAFWGAAPIVRDGAYTQTYATASKTVAAPTAATLTDSTGGTANTTLAAVETTYTQATIRNNFADLAAMVNKLTADELNTRQVLTAVIDTLQAAGITG